MRFWCVIFLKIERMAKDKMFWDHIEWMFCQWSVTEHWTMMTLCLAVIRQLTDTWKSLTFMSKFSYAFSNLCMKFVDTLTINNKNVELCYSSARYIRVEDFFGHNVWKTLNIILLKSCISFGKGIIWWILFGKMIEVDVMISN